jgi:hypothetical protein
MQRILTPTILAISLATCFLGCSEPLTTREKGTGIGTLTGPGSAGLSAPPQDMPELAPVLALH